MCSMVSRRYREYFEHITMIDLTDLGKQQAMWFRSEFNIHSSGE